MMHPEQSSHCQMPPTSPSSAQRVCTKNLHYCQRDTGLGSGTLQIHNGQMSLGYSQARRSNSLCGLCECHMSESPWPQLDTLQPHSYDTGIYQVREKLLNKTKKIRFPYGLHQHHREENCLPASKHEDHGSLLVISNTTQQGLGMEPLDASPLVQTSYPAFLGWQWWGTAASWGLGDSVDTCKLSAFQGVPTSRSPGQNTGQNLRSI